MQQYEIKILQFKDAVGKVFKKIRLENAQISISKFAREFDLDRGNLSRIERGQLSCGLITAWKIAEASNIKFSDFAKLLEEELGEDFKLIDE